MTNSKTPSDMLATIWQNKTNQTRKMARLIFSNPNCDDATSASIDAQFKFGNDYEACVAYAAELGVALAG